MINNKAVVLAYLGEERGKKVTPLTVDLNQWITLTTNQGNLNCLQVPLFLILLNYEILPFSKERLCH